MESPKNCRVCLKLKPRRQLKFIFSRDGKIAREIFACTGVLIIDMVSNRNPAMICDKCCELLEIAVEFRNLCQNSDATIRELFYENEERIWSKKLVSLQFGMTNDEPLIPEVEMGVKMEVEAFANPYGESYVDVIQEPDDMIQYVALEIEDPEYIDEEEEVMVTTDILDDTFRCHICSSVHPNASALNQHIRRHQYRKLKLKEDAPVQCLQCEKAFPSSKALDFHARKKHNDGEFTCDYCGQLFFSRSKLRFHLKDEAIYMQKERARKKFQCTLCGKSCKNNFILEKHKNLHKFFVDNKIKDKPEEEKVPFMCKLCGGVSKNSNQHRLHYREHKRRGDFKANKRIYQCKICDMTFDRDFSYNQHTYNHRRTNQFNKVDARCFYCNRSFWSTNALKTHISRLHKNSLDYECDYCGEKFLHSSGNKKNVRFQATYHLKKHALEKFRKEKKLKNMKIPEDLLPCSFCGKFILGIQRLKSHENFHTIGDQPHKYCDLCGNKFLSITNLRNHMKYIHILKRVFTCPDCPGVTFQSRHVLERHYARSAFHQGGVKQFKCQFCEKEYFSEQCLKKHCRRYHVEKLNLLDFSMKKQVKNVYE